MKSYVPTYCTPEEVADTLDLPDENDNYGSFGFSDMSHPSYNQVCKMICANEDVIDRRLRRSWRVNYVKDHILNIPKYWQDENAWRMEYYRQGGNCVQLRKDILPWDPRPILDDEVHTKDVDSCTSYKVGQYFTNVSGEYQVQTVTPDDETQPSGPGKITYQKVIHRDKLEVRTNSNIWLDMSEKCIDSDAAFTSEDAPYSDFESLYAADAQNNTFWIDHVNGRLFLKRRVYMPAAQGMRISYRWGTTDDEIPAAINRLACLLTAINVITMQVYHVRLGTGGDVTGIKDALIKGWQEECNSIWASFQRPGSVYSLLR